MCISPTAWEYVGLGPNENGGFIAVDYEQPTLILCGKDFSDTSALKGALKSVAAPTISAHSALPLPAWLLAHGESIVLLFASEKTVQSFPTLQKVLVSNGAGVVLGLDGVETIFKSKDSKAPNLFKFPSSIIMLAADSSGVIPSISKLTPGQVAYHFLAGYQNGNFVPAYESGPMSLDPVIVAKDLSSISSFLANVNVGEKHITGEEILKSLLSPFLGLKETT